METLPSLVCKSTQEDLIPPYIYDVNIVIKRRNEPIISFLHKQVAEIFKAAMADRKLKETYTRYNNSRNSLPSS